MLLSSRKQGRDPNQGTGLLQEEAVGTPWTQGHLLGLQLIIYLGDPCTPLAAWGHSPMAGAQRGRELSSQCLPRVLGKWG